MQVREPGMLNVGWVLDGVRIYCDLVAVLPAEVYEDGII